MYLARFSIDDRSYVQVAVAVVLLADASPPHARDAEPEQVVLPLLDLPDVFVTHRVSLREDRFERHWLVTARSGDEDAVRRWARHVVRSKPTSLTSSTAFEVLESREEHDRVLDSKPRFVSRIALPAYQLAGTDRYASLWIGGGPQGSQHWEALLRRAWIHGHDLWLQTTYLRCRPKFETLKELKKNAVGLSQRPGITGERLALFDAVVQRYAASGHRAFEFIGSDDEDAPTWLNGALSELPSPRGFEPALERVVEDDEIAVEWGVAPHVDTDDAARILAAVGDDDVVRALTWRPRNAALHLMNARPLADAPDEAVALAWAPGRSDAGRRFVFVSYCRRDGHALRQLLARLAEAEIDAWWDHEIRGGSHWLQVLERRLDDCDAVIALVSDLAGRSRFVRNELTYAHLIGKPIVPVRIDGAAVPEGLGLVLRHLNWLDAEAEHLDVALRRAISTATSIP